jgi:hypothetical protein
MDDLRMLRPGGRFDNAHHQERHILATSSNTFSMART